MSLLQWQLGHLNVSFDKEVPVPSYISFEQQPQHHNNAPKQVDEDEDDLDDILQGGAGPNWASIHNRYRVVATGEITENVMVNNVNVDFDIHPNRPSRYGLENMPLPRQVVLAMIHDMPAVHERFSENRWEQAVRDVTTKMRGYDGPLEFPFQGPGEQKWVVKRMRDVGPLTTEQRHKLENSQGRIKTNMFWFAQREWDFIRAVLNLGLPEVEALLRPNVLQILTDPGLPTKAKDVLPRNYQTLFDNSWLINVVPPDMGTGTSESEEYPYEGGPPGAPPGNPPQGPPGAPPGNPPQGPQGGPQGGPPGPRGGPRPSNWDVGGPAFQPNNGYSASSSEHVAPPRGPPIPRQRSRQSNVINVATESPELIGPPLAPPPIRSQVNSPVRSVARSISRSENSARSEVSARSVSGSPVFSAGRASSSSSEPQVPLIGGGDSLSSETGKYRGEERWTGQFQEIDNFTKATGYNLAMNALFNKHRNNAARRAPTSELYAYILQTLDTIQEPAMLHPLLYLLEQNMFVASLDNLKEKQLIDQSFNEMTLLQICNNSWLEMKPWERFRVIPDKFQIARQDNNQELFFLGYVNNNPSKPNVTILTLDPEFQEVRNKEILVNFLPVLLFQIVNNPLSICQEHIEFLNWSLLSEDAKRLLQTVYGQTHVTTKQHLKQRLLTLQEDLGFYKLNKQGQDYFAHPTEKMTMVVFLIKPGISDVTYETIETWMTGYVINNTNQLTYNIVKQNPDVNRYPWIYTIGEEAVFEGENHVKIELICRRKLKPDLQGVGFTLVSYFLSHFAHFYGNISMALIDVARTHGDQGLPDPMFSQLLHERFKFQRAFNFEPILQSPFVLGLPQAEREQTMTALNNIFSTQDHAPYVKQYVNPVNFNNRVLQEEFYNLNPADIDLNHLQDPDVQQTLHSAAKTLTFVRPMPTLRDMESIYQRFYQSVAEKNKRVAPGSLQAY